MSRCTLPATLLLIISGFGSVAHAEIPYADQLTPGTLRGIAMDPGDAWVLGYWEYLPANFDELADGELLPLVVFLPGIGEFDSDSACPGDADLCAPQECNNDGLCRNLTWGPQSLMRVDQWDDTQRPFIMVSPQNPVPTFSAQEWDLDDLDAFFQFVIDNYPVDPRRLYLTGMSQGGRGTMQYVAAHPRRFTAAVPTPGGSVGFAASCEFADTAFWVFHGEDDQDGNLGPGVFNPCDQVEMLYMYNNPDEYPDEPECVTALGEPRPVGRMTMYYSVAHSSWIPTIDPIGAGFAASTRRPTIPTASTAGSSRSIDPTSSRPPTPTWCRPRPSSRRS
jgi:pimeloyl-ACP methyl ester carboxylesterase